MGRIKDGNLDSTAFEEYIDQHGLIVTGEGDGGDTCANQFSYHYAQLLSNSSAASEPRIAYVHNSLRLLFGPHNIPIRHPQNRYGDWAGRTQATSRDQLTPVLAYLMADPWLDYRDRLFRAHRANYLCRAWNVVRNGQRNVDGPYKKADITGPDIWAMWIRIYRNWSLYPLLCVLDLHVLVAVLIDVLWYKAYITQPAWLIKLLRLIPKLAEIGSITAPDKDQRNLALKVHSGATFMPTPLSWLAMRLYSQSGLFKWAATQFWQLDPNEPPMHAVLLPLFSNRRPK